MKRKIALLTIMLFSSSSLLLGQSREKLLIIHGQLLNNKNELVRGLGTIELIGKDGKVKRATRTDLDGNFSFKICPDQLNQTKVVFRIVSPGNALETQEVNLIDQKLKIKLSKPDPSIDIRAYKEYDFKMLAKFECGTGYFEEHEYFQNCSGEIRKGTELIQADADMSEWTAIE